MPRKKADASLEKNVDEKVIAKLPKDQMCWVTTTNEDGQVWITTSDNIRQNYYLFKVTGMVKVSKAATPQDFQDLVSKQK